MLRPRSGLLTLGASLLALFAHATPASANPASPFPWWPGVQAAPAAATLGYCAAPSGLPRVRTSGDLVVESPPRAKPERWLRLRTHSSPPDMSGKRYWEGPDVPSFVPLALGNLELDLLDPIPGGYLALYRSHANSVGPNDSFEARLFSCGGQTLAAVPLNPLLSRRDQLEVQDIRYADGTLYFNEACQTYSRDAGGRCSSLVAVNPATKQLIWRTVPLVSNSVIRVEPKYVIVGYGFTAEKDFVRVVRRSDGHVVETKSLPSSHFELELQGDVLDVEVGGKWASFRMSGFDGSSPRLTSLGTHATRSASPAVGSPAAAPISAWTLPQQLPALPWLPPAPRRGATAAQAIPWSLPALPSAAELQKWAGQLRQ